MALAPVVFNAYAGRDARYDVSGLQRLPDGSFTDGVYRYDSNGLGINRPNPSYDPNLPNANNMNGWTPGMAAPASGGGGASGLAGAAISSPWYQQAQAATQAAAAADAANRKAAIQQMLIQFGLVPEGFSDPYGDVDQTTRDLAAANTQSGISAAARLKQALADAQRDSSRRLTAKGLRRSGARGYQMRRNQLGYDQNYSDAVAKLLGLAQGVYSGFAQNEYTRSMNLASALANALNNMGSFYSPTSTQTMSFAPASSGGGSSSTPTIGTSSNYYGPAPGTPGGGYTSPQKPLLMPEGY